MKPPRWRGFVLALAAALPAALLPPGRAQAQEWGLYLACTGTVQAKGRSTEAHLDLAMRRNNGQALIERSNLLPAGDRFRFETSPAHYTMVLRAPSRGSVVYYDWLRGALFVWEPDLAKLHTTRISVNRRSAALEGEMLDGEGKSLGRLTMRCEPKDNDSIPEPKF